MDTVALSFPLKKSPQENQLAKLEFQEKLKNEQDDKPKRNTFRTNTTRIIQQNLKSTEESINKAFQRSVDRSERDKNKKINESHMQQLWKDFQNPPHLLSQIKYQKKIEMIMFSCACIATVGCFIMYLNWQLFCSQISSLLYV